MTSTIQIPNITINGNDYWDSHKSQYNEMIDKSITPLTIDLVGYPTSNTISIADPTEEYYYTDNSDNEIRNYPLTKNTNLNVKINKMPEFWEVPRELTAQGVYGYPSSNFTVTLPDSVTSIGDDGLFGCFERCSTITSFDFNNVTRIGIYGAENCFNTSSISAIYVNKLISVNQRGLYQTCYRCTSLTTAPTFASLTTVGNNGLENCFYWCTNMTTASTFPSLTTIGNSGFSSCFNNCSSLTTAPTFPSLTTIGNNGFNSCFSSCTSLTTAPTFPSLTTIGNSGFYGCFQDCTSLTGSISFPSLTTIESTGLRNCFRNTKITSLSFPALTSTSFGTYTNQFNNMLSRVTGCTVHFPSNLQSVIGSWTDVTNGFGGTNTSILYDLTATS